MVTVCFAEENDTWLQKEQVLLVFPVDIQRLWQEAQKNAAIANFASC